MEHGDFRPSQATCRALPIFRLAAVLRRAVRLRSRSVQLPCLNSWKSSRIAGCVVRFGKMKPTTDERDLDNAPGGGACHSVRADAQSASSSPGLPGSSLMAKGSEVGGRRSEAGAAS